MAWKNGKDEKHLFIMAIPRQTFVTAALYLSLCYIYACTDFREYITYIPQEIEMELLEFFMLRKLEIIKLK